MSGDVMKLHAEFLVKDGKKEFAILPYEEFVYLQELVADMEDLRDFRAAKKAESHKPSISLEKAKQEL